MTHHLETIENIKKRLESADAEEYAILKHSFSDDPRKGVRSALSATQRRLDKEQAERERIDSLYAYQESLSQNMLTLGLDEVGRGPLAGPLTVAGVVLPPRPRIRGLNDSKKIPEAQRELIAAEIKEYAIAWDIQHIDPIYIDTAGMTASLRVAFSRVIQSFDDAGVGVEVILLDGNPMKLDEREISVIKGDASCAAIAAASIIAKVERDSLMRAYADQYPKYHFESCKGYASEQHIAAIKEYGLTPIHRESFCRAFTQPSLF